MSKRWPKARAAPRHRTARILLVQRAVVPVVAYCASKVPCEKIEPLKNCACLRFAQECWLTHTCAAVMGDERYDRLGALLALCWYQW